MMQKIAIAVSGGIDSLVAAYLLKQMGHEVVGIHFLTGFENSISAQGHRITTGENPIAGISRQLHMPVEIIDCSAEFKTVVVDYFTRTYLAGQTPNPCLKCNPLIKFGTVLKAARQMGAAYLATGHYARIQKGSDGRRRLFRAHDPTKDQSYFLAFLSPHQLGQACFPLGEMSKDEVIQLAAEKRLQPVTRQESQDICFLGSIASYGDFLKQQPGFESRPGPIETIDGKTIGHHNGLHLFTIGQRKGINCPAAEPYYVFDIDTTNNKLVVGFKKDLLSSECLVADINWIHPAPSSSIKVKTQLRYRHQAVDATLIPTGDDKAVVRFQQPQSSITPGQGAVFYRHDEVLGGGWIQPPAGR
jgi:tRNA-specific 2-thiouridylase